MKRDVGTKKSVRKTLEGAVVSKKTQTLKPQPIVVCLVFVLPRMEKLGNGSALTLEKTEGQKRHCNYCQKSWIRCSGPYYQYWASKVICRNSNRKRFSLSSWPGRKRKWKLNTQRFCKENDGYKRRFICFERSKTVCFNNSPISHFRYVFFCAIFTLKIYIEALWRE